MPQPFLHYYPFVLAVILCGTAIYNLWRDRHVQREMERRGIPPWLRWPAVGAELHVPLLLFALGPVPALLLAMALLLGSLLLCLLTGWYRRLWLSVPLSVLTACWLYLFFFVA